MLRRAMPSADGVALFALASLALLIVPGPAVLYVVARSIDRGRTAGLVSTFGVGVGSLVHVVGAALGISAVLAASAAAFTAVKMVGAAYLILLGIRRILGGDGIRVRSNGSEESPVAVFRQGVVVNVLNPKTALFFLTFLPQFVDPSRGPAALQMLLLGGLFVAMGIVSDGAYALGADALGAWMRRRPGVLCAQRYVTGGTLIGLGALAAAGGPGEV
jgi:threonine/homoserine/homoserine lactone efflux protein